MTVNISSQNDVLWYSYCSAFKINIKTVHLTLLLAVADQGFLCRGGGVATL